MIVRLWNGWTSTENADRYENLLETTVFPRIESKGIDGYRRIRLLRAIGTNDEVQFTTLMEFDHLDAVKSFVGEDFKNSYVPEEAKRILSRYDKHSTHFEVIEDRAYP